MCPVGPTRWRPPTISEWITGPGTVTIVDNGSAGVAAFAGRLRDPRAQCRTQSVWRRPHQDRSSQEAGKSCRVSAAKCSSSLLPVLDGDVGISNETDRHLLLKNADRELVVDKRENVVIQNRYVTRRGGYQQVDYRQFTSGRVRVPTSIAYQSTGLRQLIALANVRVNTAVDSSIIVDALNAVA